MTKLESDGAASPVTAVEPALAAPAPARANEATTEIEEIATEHMEICMEVNFPESISLEAGVTSSQLAPHVRDGIRSDAASAVERLRAAGAWQCESCGAAGNEPWQPCKCGKKKPVRAMEGSLRTAVKALSQPLDVTVALAAAAPRTALDSALLAYGMGARVGCAAGMQDAKENAPLPAAFRGCDAVSQPYHAKPNPEPEPEPEPAP